MSATSSRTPSILEPKCNAGAGTVGIRHCMASYRCYKGTSSLNINGVQEGSGAELRGFHVARARGILEMCGNTDVAPICEEPHHASIWTWRLAGKALLALSRQLEAKASQARELQGSVHLYYLLPGSLLYLQSSVTENLYSSGTFHWQSFKPNQHSSSLKSTSISTKCGTPQHKRPCSPQENRFF